VPQQQRDSSFQIKATHCGPWLLNRPHEGRPVTQIERRRETAAAPEGVGAVLLYWASAVVIKGHVQAFTLN
jgi:hypothetical protein